MMSPTIHIIKHNHTIDKQPTWSRHNRQAAADLTKPEKRKIHQDGTSMTLRTASGHVTAEDIIGLDVQSNNQKRYALVPDTTTPSVISVGRPCMGQRNCVHWPPYGIPYFNTPASQRIDLAVHKYVPIVAPMLINAENDELQVNVDTIHESSMTPSQASVGLDPEGLHANWFLCLFI